MPSNTRYSRITSVARFSYPDLTPPATSSTRIIALNILIAILFVATILTLTWATHILPTTDAFLSSSPTSISAPHELHQFIDDLPTFQSNGKVVETMQISVINTGGVGSVAGRGLGGDAGISRRNRLGEAVGPSPTRFESGGVIYDLSEDPRGIQPRASDDAYLFREGAYGSLEQAQDLSNWELIYLDRLRIHRAPFHTPFHEDEYKFRQGITAFHILDDLEGIDLNAVVGLDKLKREREAGDGDTSGTENDEHGEGEGDDDRGDGNVSSRSTNSNRNGELANNYNANADGNGRVNPNANANLNRNPRVSQTVHLNSNTHNQNSINYNNVNSQGNTYYNPSSRNNYSPTPNGANTYNAYNRNNVNNNANANNNYNNNNNNYNNNGNRNTPTNPNSNGNSYYSNHFNPNNAFINNSPLTTPNPNPRNPYGMYESPFYPNRPRPSSYRPDVNTRSPVTAIYGPYTVFSHSQDDKRYSILNLREGVEDQIPPPQRYGLHEHTNSDLMFVHEEQSSGYFLSDDSHDDSFPETEAYIGSAEHSGFDSNIESTKRYTMNNEDKKTIKYFSTSELHADSSVPPHSQPPDYNASQQPPFSDNSISADRSNAIDEMINLLHPLAPSLQRSILIFFNDHFETLVTHIHTPQPDPDQSHSHSNHNPCTVKQYNEHGEYDLVLDPDCISALPNKKKKQSGNKNKQQKRGKKCCRKPTKQFETAHSEPNWSDTNQHSLFITLKDLQPSCTFFYKEYQIPHFLRQHDTSTNLLSNQLPETDLTQSLSRDQSQSSIPPQTGLPGTNNAHREVPNATARYEYSTSAKLSDSEKKRLYNHRKKKFCSNLVNTMNSLISLLRKIDHDDLELAWDAVDQDDGSE